MTFVALLRTFAIFYYAIALRPVHELKLLIGGFTQDRQGLYASLGCDGLGKGQVNHLADMNKKTSRRLAVVESYAVRATSSDECLDTYVRLTAAMCDTPIALISIVERDKQRFIARYGLETKQMDLQDAFCAQAIEHPNEVLVVPDARCDPRFANNSLVTGEPFIRFYAGAPLTTAAGVALGTLCVMGPRPRVLEKPALAALALLKNAVVASLEQGRLRRWNHEANPFCFEQNPNPMWIYDVETLQFLAVNDAAIGQYGYKRDEFLAMTLRDIRPPQDYPSLAADIAQVRHGLAHSRGWKHRKRDGSLIDVTITSEQVRYGDRLARLVLATDVTRETQAEIKLAYLAHHDPLTGVLNRAGFHQAFDMALDTAHKANSGGAVLFLDLERFKAINDTLGHAAGDDLLICVARRLQAVLRQYDLVARTGGDEFVMFVQGLRERQQAERLVDDILDAIRQPFCIEGHTFSIGITIGVCFHPTDGTTSGPLLKAADTAMYRAKRSASSVDFYCVDQAPSHRTPR